MNESAASELFRRLNREVWVLTSAHGTERGGLVATFVNSASIVPEIPRVVAGVAKAHHTWSLIEESGAFALHLLDEAHLDWAWRFGLQSGRDFDKLAGLAWREGLSGSPILDDAPGWLDCRVEARLDTGDRTVYLANVLDAKPIGSQPILTLARMLEHASSEQKAKLRAQMERQGAIDSLAIKAWREGQRK